MAEPDDLGGVTPRKKRGFGTYVFVGAAVALLIGGLVMFTGGNKAENPSNGDTNTGTTPTTIPQLKSSIDSLNAQVSGFSGRLANLESQMAGLVAPSVTKADIDSLQASINNLSSKLAILNATVANITGTGTGDGGTVYVGEISRWDFDSLRILGCTDDYTFEVVSKSPSRIEDEDLYEIIVAITNPPIIIASTWNETEVADAMANATIALNHELEIILSPRDYCMVNEDSTYLDSDSYPYLNWDTDFVTRTREGQEVCRRVTFTSEKYDFGNLLPGNSLELDLVFELYYS